MTEVSPLGGPDTIYRQHLAEGRFMIQRGVKSGKAVFHPRSVAPETGEDLEWFEPTGLGTVYSVSVIAKRPPESDYNVALIDLDEGVRMMSRVEGLEAKDVRIGMRVKARIMPQDEGHLVVFDALQENGQ